MLNFRGVFDGELPQVWGKLNWMQHKLPNKNEPDQLLCCLNSEKDNERQLQPSMEYLSACIINLWLAM